MSYLEQILGQGPAVDAEAGCIDAFVKQASAEGIDLNQIPDENINAAYADYREKFAAAQAGEDTADGLIEKAAASGASDEMLEQLALSKLSGEAMFEGWRDSFEKYAQEAEAMEAEEPAAEEPAAEEGGDLNAEEAEAILEAAVEEAVAAVTEEAPDAAPEEIAQAAAEILPEVVEEKTSEYVKEASKADPGRFRKAYGATKGFLKKHPVYTAGGAGVAGVGAGVGGTLLARRKSKKASDILAEMLMGKEATAADAASHLAHADAEKGPGRFRRGLTWASKTIKKHPYRAGGIGAGVLGAGVGGTLLARRKAKKASDILAEMLMNKEAVGTPPAELGAGRARQLAMRIGRGVKKHPYAAGGIGAGVLGAGVGGTLLARRRKSKKASDILAEMLMGSG